MAVEGAADGFFDSSNDILIAEQRENIGFNKDRSHLSLLKPTCLY